MSAMTLFPLICFVVLHGAFIWARYRLFRIDGKPPPGVRVIEISAVICIVSGIGLIALARPSSAAFGAMAVALAALSAIVFLWALRSVAPMQLSAAFSTDVPGRLIRSGAYRYVRNPFYLSYVLAYAVPLFASRSAWGLLPLGWMACLYLQAARFEERKFLASPLGEEYRCYSRETGRFLPRLRTWSDGLWAR